MKIVVIEDEQFTADDLVDILKDLEPDASIVAVLKSVQEARVFFETKPEVDLIFSDIQLGDGLSFDLFNKVQTSAPIVFCTAYDEYTLNAFKTNGIAYVLKPFTLSSIRSAIDKFKMLQKALAPSVVPYSDLMKLLGERPAPKVSSILVYHKEKIIPVRLEDVALFFIRNEVTHLNTFDKKTYFVNKTLDEIEKVGGGDFFRANRQYLVNRRAVQDASNYLSRKFSISLSIPFSDTITVSKEKMQPFLSWLSE
jgi:two-component system response regulator LytT